MKKIVGLGLMITSLLLAIGTIAPAVITLNNRSATITVVNDTNGLIQLKGIGPYGSVVSLDGNGKTQIDFSASTMSGWSTFAPSASGCNPAATFKLQDVIQLHNAGPESYVITISSNSARVQFWTRDGQWWNYHGGSTTPAQSLTIGDASGTLGSGCNIDIGLFIDTTGLAHPSMINAKITITATNP